jgi:hypothetical protein
MMTLSDHDHNLLILRTQIEIRLFKLGLESRLRWRIVKAIARISNIRKLTALALGLGVDRASASEAA